MVGCECGPILSVWCLWDDFIVRAAGNGTAIGMERSNVLDMYVDGCDGCVLRSV